MISAETATARRVIAGLSLFVVSAVGVVIFAGPGRNPAAAPAPDSLATVNAALNGAAAFCLVVGLAAIRARRVRLHRAAMTSAFAISGMFLVSYLVHHARVGSVPFRGQGFARAVYLGLLVPHIVLAAVVVPLALLTLLRGWTGDVERHRPLARVTLPIWLYVSVTGVVLYWMLYSWGAS